MNPWPARRWTDEEILDSLRAWTELTGETPSPGQWVRADHSHPSRTTVVARWGSWNAALNVAGLTPRRSTRRFDHAEAARMRKAGVPDSEVARRLGVNHSAIHQALGKRPKTTLPRRRRSREQRIEDLKRAVQYQPKGEPDASHDARADRGTA